MAENCSVIKFFLVIFNLLLLVGGLVFVACGVGALIDPDFFIDSFNDYYYHWRDAKLAVSSLYMVSGLDIYAVIRYSAIYLIALGGTLVIISMMGFCLVASRNSCCVGFHLFIAVILMLSQIGALAAAVVLPNQFKSEAEKNAIRNVENYFHRDLIFSNDGQITLSTNTFLEKHMSIMQQLQVCCGVGDGMIYDTFLWDNQYNIGGNMMTAVRPASCCSVKVPGKHPTHINDFIDLPECLRNRQTSVVNYGSCLHSLNALIQKYEYGAIGVSAAVAFFLILLIGLEASALCGKTNKVQPM